MRERVSIGRINGAEIYAVRNENGETYVPIKPICEAIGVSHQKQIEKLNEDEILSSTVTLRVTVGADGKDREMVCLPLEYVYGWLFTINPKNVKAESRESVIRYKKECYDVFCRHFFTQVEKQRDINRAEAEELENLRQLIEEEKDVEMRIKESKEKIDKIRAARLDPDPSLFD